MFQCPCLSLGFPSGLFPSPTPDLFCVSQYQKQPQVWHASIFLWPGSSVTTVHVIQTGLACHLPDVVSTYSPWQRTSSAMCPFPLSTLSTAELWLSKRNTTSVTFHTISQLPCNYWSSTVDCEMGWITSLTPRVTKTSFSVTFFPWDESLFYCECLTLMQTNEPGFSKQYLQKSYLYGIQLPNLRD